MNQSKKNLVACLFTSILYFVSSTTYAQRFLITDGSPLYDAELQVECNTESCEGLGRVTLFKKNTKKVVEQFTSDDLNFYLDEKKLKPTVNVIELYGEQSPLIFDDFNFDGNQDLAIRNGNEGSYGGPSYDVYVFHQNKKQFVYSEELSALTYENLGMFSVDSDKKRIITFNKSGCCYHISSEYVVVPRKGLVLVRELEEEVVSTADKVRVTEKNLIGSKWQEKIKYYPIGEYYDLEH